MIVKIAIDIPSGKLVCGNDFRDYYRKDRYDVNFDVNEVVGIKQTIEEYGRRGLFHGFVGNSCPGLYLKGNRLNIVSLAYDEETDEIIEDRSLGDRVGSICTDLWWYSIADYDDFISRGGKTDKRWDSVIDVEPGRYVLNHNLDLSGRDCHMQELFAFIERSDEEIVPWRMPEEGAAEAIMSLLPERFKSSKTIKVDPPKDADEDYIENYWKGRHDTHTYYSRLYVKTAWKIKDGIDPDDYSIMDRYEQIGYKVWGKLYEAGDDVDHFINDVIVSAEELQDYQDIADRVVKSFIQQKKDSRVRDSLLGKNFDDMTLAESKELREYLDRLKQETKNHLKIL